MSDKTSRRGRRRRGVLKAAACALLVGGSTGVAAGSQADDAEPTVVFSDQTTGGDTVVIDEVQSDRSSSLFVSTRTGETVAGEGVRFTAGDGAEDLELSLDEPLEESRTLVATLYESNGGPIAEDSAEVTVEANSQTGTRAGEPAGESDAAGAAVAGDDETQFGIGTVAAVGVAAYLLGSHGDGGDESSAAR